MDDKESGDASLRQLGEYIRLQRQMADLSLRRMAELTHVSNAYLSQVERGLHQPSIRVLRAIATALDVSADTLLVQAGLMSGATGGGGAYASSAPPGPQPGPPQAGEGEHGSGSADTEAAIRNDPGLTPEDREALIRIYRSLRRKDGPSERA